MDAILEPSIKKYEEEGQLSVKQLWVLFFFYVGEIYFNHM